MKFLRNFFIVLFVCVLLFGFVLPMLYTPHLKNKSVRIGYFPNIGHAQAMIGRKQQLFDQAFGSDAQVEWTVFNAGPSAIEALFAGHLDIAYVGPSPAVNGYVKSQGQALRVVAGASGGGAALVVRKDLDIRTPAGFRNKKMASPQLGNTQDVALRSWLSGQGLKLRDFGGDVEVLPLSNADQLTLFIKKEIDAAWTVEPWVTLLVKKGGGRVYLDEKSLWPGGHYPSTLVIVRKKFLDEHRDLVKQFLKTHKALTKWILENPEESKKIVSDEIIVQTGKKIEKDVLDSAWKRLEFTFDPMKEVVKKQARSAFAAGFLKQDPDLSGLFELKLLDELDEREK